MAQRLDVEIIRIGPISYKVVDTDDLCSVGTDGARKYLHGRINFGDDTIEVNQASQHDRRVCTLWHESLHGILEAAGHPSHAETMVVVMGFGLVRLMRDNPALVKLTMTCPTPAKPLEDLTTVQLGATPYTVRMVEKLHVFAADDRRTYLHGRIRYGAQLIEIDTDQAPNHMVVTLWHELLHGLIDNSGQIDPPEAEIIALGFGLVQLMRDNPLLVDLTMGFRNAHTTAVAS